MRFQTVLFDVDGTLIDSTEAILQAFRKAHSQLNLDYPGDETMKKQFGKSLMEIIDTLGLKEAIVKKFVDIFTKTELSSDRFSIVEPLKGCLHRIIDKIDGLNLVTSKRFETAMHSLEVTNLDKSVNILISADNVKKTKPNPEPLLKALEVLGQEATEEVVYIGDSIPDIIAANSAGISFIGVIWGVHGEKLKEFTSFPLVKSCDELAKELDIII